MKSDPAGPVGRSDPGHSAGNCLPFQRFLRTDSPWPWRAWVFFCCALVFCTVQGNPSWTHPDLRLGWPQEACFWILGVSGAVTGWVVARYRLAGLPAGALAGCGSLLAAVSVFQGFDHLPRYAVVIVEVIGLLPGVALYCILHITLDSFPWTPPDQPGNPEG